LDISAEEIINHPERFLERGYWQGEGQQLKASKKKAKLKRVKPIIGYFDTSTVNFDFDKKPLKTVKYWAKVICKKFKLGGYIILKSSDGNYHVVFDRSVSWKMNVMIMCWVSLLVEGKRLKNCPLTKYVLMCGIKTVSCLRIGRKKVEGKKEKASPRTVFKLGKQDNEIKNYFLFRKNLKPFLDL
jgi:hypothetical protein